jgi:hypothetical protein
MFLKHGGCNPMEESKDLQFTVCKTDCGSALAAILFEPDIFPDFDIGDFPTGT